MRVCVCACVRVFVCVQTERETFLNMYLLYQHVGNTSVDCWAVGRETAVFVTGECEEVRGGVSLTGDGVSMQTAPGRSSSDTAG